MSVIDLTNRSTRSARIPTIDSLYVYQESHKHKFTHKIAKGYGYKYIQSNVPTHAGVDEIHIYYRTAEIRGVSNQLTLVTKNSKYRQVQKWFNEQIKQIESDDKLFDKFSHASATPIELGILYTY